MKIIAHISQSSSLMRFNSTLNTWTVVIAQIFWDFLPDQYLIQKRWSRILLFPLDAWFKWLVCCRVGCQWGGVGGDSVPAGVRGTGGRHVLPGEGGAVGLLYQHHEPQQDQDGRNCNKCYMFAWERVCRSLVGSLSYIYVALCCFGPSKMELSYEKFVNFLKSKTKR